MADLLKDYGAGSPWIEAQKLDPTTKKALIDELVSLLRRETKNFHKLAQSKNDKSRLKAVRPLYQTYFVFVPSKDPDTPDNINEMRYYYADLLYECEDYSDAAANYAQVTGPKYGSLAMFNRILSYREASKTDKKYGDALITATNEFVTKYPNDKRAGDLMYASANQAFEPGAQDQ